jgi:hypothetical protein
MHVLKKETAPRYTRPEGITSYLLASPRTSGAEHLTTTLAVLQPGGEQRIHSHRPEQVYWVQSRKVQPQKPFTARSLSEYPLPRQTRER